MGLHIIKLGCFTKEKEKVKKKNKTQPQNAEQDVSFFYPLFSLPPPF